MVMTGASSIAPAMRERFLASVQDHLLHFDRKIRDDDIAEAIVSVREAFTESSDYDW
jgi:hypothetical protein